MNRTYTTVAGALFITAITAMALRKAVLVFHGVDVFSDDAYYYIIGARNLAQGLGFTFDGINQTSGFHPLWFFLLSLGYLVFGTDAPASAQYQVIFLAEVWFWLIASLAVLWGWLRARDEDGDKLFFAVLLFALIGMALRKNLFFMGMECGLCLPLFLMMGVYFWRGRCLAAGMAGMFLVLGRIDSLIFMILPMTLLCLLGNRRDWRQALRSGLNMIGPTMIALLTLAAFNCAFFGDTVPINARLKSSFPTIHFQLHQFVDFDNPRFFLQINFFSLIGTIAGMIMLLFRTERISRRHVLAGWTAGAVCLVQLASFVLFQRWAKPTPVWYQGGPYLVACFTFGMGLANLLPRRAFNAVLLTACLVVSLFHGYGLVKASRYSQDQMTEQYQSDFQALYRFARITSPKALWAYTDAGGLAFHSDRAVVNLDGLVNTMAYQDALGQGKLADYLKSKKIKYLVFGAWDRPQTEKREYEPMYTYRVAPKVYSGDYDEAEYYLYGYRDLVYSDTVRLPRRAEVWRSPGGLDGLAKARFVVFDLDLVFNRTR